MYVSNKPNDFYNDIFQMFPFVLTAIPLRLKLVLVWTISCASCGT